MASTYLQLVNKLRDRFNEPALTSNTFTTTVGFDQFTKEAINYAYRDIMNAELEWPFLFQNSTFLTTPGVQFYTPTISPTPTGFSGDIINFDMRGFYVQGNYIAAKITLLNQTIPSTFPYQIDVTSQLPTSVSGTGLVSGKSVPVWAQDFSVTFTSNNNVLTAVDDDPAQGEYTIYGPGQYRFNSADAGKLVKIIFYEVAAAVEAPVINANNLSVIDFDVWRSSYLDEDKTAPPIAWDTPQMVFLTNTAGQIGLHPIPNHYYTISWRCWMDVNELNASTDTSVLPTRFETVLLDGATKYVYEFREDAQMAQLADARFRAGIARMRIQLINRDATMQTGARWYPHGYSYTLTTPNPR